jgi:hypothetical protein
VSLIDDITNFALGVGGILEQVDGIIADSELLIEHVRKEVHDLQAFKVDPKWKNRVINAPKAIAQTKDLVHRVPEALRVAFVSFKTNLKAITQPVLGGQGRGGVIPGEPAGGRAIFNLLNRVKLLLNEFDEFIKALDGLVEAIRSVTEELEKAETLFLQQKNPRKRDSGFMLRIGSLHPE